MSRSALIDAAWNAVEDVQLPPLSTANVQALMTSGFSSTRESHVDFALDAVTELTRSLRERHDGTCFFSALAMASDSLTGKHYTVDELKRVLVDILQGDDLIGGWETYRASEVADLESIAYYERNNLAKSGKRTQKQIDTRYQEMMQKPEQLRSMSLQEYTAYVLTPEHWANEETLLIYSTYFNIQFVPMKPGDNPLEWEVVPIKRGSNADAFIFLYFSAQGQHYDLLLSKVPHVRKLKRGQVSPEEITVFTKDTLTASNYAYIKEQLADIAVTPVLYSKLPVLQ